MSTYDISVDENGQKFRIYNQPESVVRELGILPREMQIRTVEEAKAVVDGLVKQVNALKLAGEPKRNDSGYGRVEYMVPWDRKEGTIEDIPREVTSDEKTTYAAVWDKKEGTIRGD